jgi:hypothetical protein
MTWTGRSEVVACCAGGYGPVRNEEHVARLLHSEMPGGEPFGCAELFWDERAKKRPFSNSCGDADGSSVVRCSTLSDFELQTRSEQFALGKANRSAQGAIVAEASHLRKIELEDRSGEQLVFVYDDPKSNEPLHAVVRGSLQLSRPDQRRIRDKIKGAFGRKCPPRSWTRGGAANQP